MSSVDQQRFAEIVERDLDIVSSWLCDFVSIGFDIVKYGVPAF